MYYISIIYQKSKKQNLKKENKYKSNSKSGKIYINTE